MLKSFQLVIPNVETEEGQRIANTGFVDYARPLGDAVEDVMRSLGSLQHLESHPIIPSRGPTLPEFSVKLGTSSVCKSAKHKRGAPDVKWHAQAVAILLPTSGMDTNTTDLLSQSRLDKVQLIFHSDGLLGEVKDTHLSGLKQGMEEASHAPLLEQKCKTRSQ
jgi:hypothetical protein